MAFERTLLKWFMNHLSGEGISPVRIFILKKSYKKEKSFIGKATFRYDI